MNFESIDIEKSPHAFALFDEGCHSTRHIAVHGQLKQRRS